MKLNAIKKICKDALIFRIINMPDGAQWIGTGCAAYPVEGFRVTADMIPAIFDLTEKVQEKMIIREEAGTEYKRLALVPMEGEENLENLGLVYAHNNFYRALLSKNGVIFINNKYTKPAENKDGDFVFSARRMENDKMPLIACYADMLCGAVIVPAVGTAIMEDLQKITGSPMDVFWDAEDETQ